MPTFLPAYGDTEGPLGFPMRGADVKILDQILKDNPESEYHRVVVEKATTELMDGERADVSWNQTEIIDRVGDVVLTSGFRDEHFKGNPIVTINHDYTKSPIGRSLELLADRMHRFPSLSDSVPRWRSGSDHVQFNCYPLYGGEKSGTETALPSRQKSSFPPGLKNGRNPFGPAIRNGGS